jgi:hypothetical protein
MILVRITFPWADGLRQTTDVRRIGGLLGGTLPAIVYPLQAALGLGLSSWLGGTAGSTLEGFAFDPLMISIATLVGVVLGSMAARRVVETKRPLLWMIGLAFIAPPLGVFVFQALTAVDLVRPGGDVARWLAMLVYALPFSYAAALPTSAAVSAIAVILLRRLVSWSPLARWAVLAVLLAPALIVASGAFATSAARYGFGPAVRAPIPTLSFEPPVSRDEAIAAAEPFASELSRAPALLDSANAYEISNLCDPEDPFPNDFACGMTGPVWAVAFTITAPDGEPGRVLVVIDAVSGELLYTEQ